MRCTEFTCRDGFHSVERKIFYEEKDMLRKIFFAFCFAFMVLILVGCSGEKRPDGFPKIYPSSITVSDDNGPLSDIKISLFAKEGNCPWPIGGTTNASGKADLVTYGKFKGAPAGEFIVVLAKSEIEDAHLMPKGNDDGIVEVNTQKPQKTSFRVFSLIDPKYSDKATSPLTMKIEQRGANETFKLGKPVRAHVSTIRTDQPEG